MKNLHEKIIPLQEIFDGTWKDIISRGKDPEIPIKFLDKLNEKLWGWRRKELVVIGGRTSMAKSSFALQIAWDVADQNIPVYFLSLEMTKESLLERLFCQVGKVDNQGLRKGMFSKDIEEKKKCFRGMTIKTPLLLTDRIGSKMTDLYHLIERLDPKPGMVIIDYVQAIASLQGERLDIMNEYIRKFRQMAIEYNFCGILVSQINRGAMATEGKEPNLWTLKGSGVLEEHCLFEDSLIFNIENGEYYKIKDMFWKRKLFPVKTIDIKNAQVKYIKPRKVIDTGKLLCFKVKTKSGKEMIVSKGTQFYNGQWKKIEDLNVGDKIYVDI